MAKHALGQDSLVGQTIGHYQLVNRRGKLTYSQTAGPEVGTNREKHTQP